MRSFARAQMATGMAQVSLDNAASLSFIRKKAPIDRSRAKQIVPELDSNAARLLDLILCGDPKQRPTAAGLVGFIDQHANQVSMVSSIGQARGGGHQRTGTNILDETAILKATLAAKEEELAAALAQVAELRAASPPAPPIPPPMADDEERADMPGALVRSGISGMDIGEIFPSDECSDEDVPRFQGHNPMPR